MNHARRAFGSTGIAVASTAGNLFKLQVKSTLNKFRVSESVSNMQFPDGEAVVQRARTYLAHVKKLPDYFQGQKLPRTFEPAKEPSQRDVSPDVFLKFEEAWDLKIIADEVATCNSCEEFMLDSILAEITTAGTNLSKKLFQVEKALLSISNESDHPQVVLFFNTRADYQLAILQVRKFFNQHRDSQSAKLWTENKLALAFVEFKNPYTILERNTQALEGLRLTININQDVLLGLMEELRLQISEKQSNVPTTVTVVQSDEKQK